jgi:hypothetical protein
MTSTALLYNPVPDPLFKNGGDLNWEPVSGEGLHELTQLFHVHDVHLAVRWVVETANSASIHETNTRPTSVDPNKVVNFVRSVNPQNTQEVMLALNMFILQEHQFGLATCARNAKSLEGVETFTNLTCKVSTALTKQMEAMAKLRGKTGNTFLQQVNVNDGGQAVVKQGS